MTRRARPLDLHDPGWALALALCAGLLGPSAIARAEAPPLEHRYQLWTQLGVKATVDPDWSLRADLALRLRDAYAPSASFVHVMLLRRVYDRMFVGLGYGFHPSWTGPGLAGVIDEHRLREQWMWQLVDPTSGVELQLRSRFEQRVRPVEQAIELGLRLREFIQLAVPILPEGRLALVFGTELFFALNDAGETPLAPAEDGAPRRSPRWQTGGVEQNRAFLGLRSDLAAWLRLELAYQNQWSVRPHHPRGDRMGHTVLVGATISAP